jgi:N-acetyl-gamma-glutamyl-phosphate reductase
MTLSAPLRVAVAGCTGYIGMQCVDLLSRHPDARLTALLGRSHAGRRYSDVVPGSRVDMEIAGDLDAQGADVVMAALPHTVAAQHAQRWLAGGAVVVDMSADFRLRAPADHEGWYGVAHPAPALCEEAAYALVEFEREALRTANLIAVPGCYPTAALIATLPALREHLVTPQVIVDAKSGISGAGRSPSMTVHFAEVNESVRAYGVAGHRHQPEMLQQLRAAAGDEVELTFVPHLVPMTRGILATAYLRPRPGVTTAEIADAYRRVCAGEPWLEYVDEPPATKSVLGTNRAAVNCTAQGGVAVVTVAIDNLIKGAAGQAVQALNVRFGFPETSGLREVASWP